MWRCQRKASRSECARTRLMKHLKIPSECRCRQNVKPKTSVTLVNNSVDILSGHVTNRPTHQTARFSDIPWSFTNYSAASISVSTYHTISFSFTSPNCTSTLRRYLKYRIMFYHLPTWRRTFETAQSTTKTNLGLEFYPQAKSPEFVSSVPPNDRWETCPMYSTSAPFITPSSSFIFSFPLYDIKRIKWAKRL